MKSMEFTLFSRKFTPRYLPVKNEKLKKSFFHILRWTSFLMIPVSTLHDEYIDRPKLTEQNPFEYIVPPPSRGVGTNIAVKRVGAKSSQTPRKSKHRITSHSIKPP